LAVCRTARRTGFPAGVAGLILGLTLLASTASETLTVDLHDANATAGFRWLDVAGQTYRSSFQTSYDYGNPAVAVSVTYTAVADAFTGTLTAVGLKPNFAYQIKIEGTPGGRLDNEWVGLAGRWWEERWLTDHWGNGANLNIQPNPNPAYDHPNPNPNDFTYYSRRDLLDGFGHPLYRYTGYLVLGYFVTDAAGAATVPFTLDNSYHVLWNTAQRTRDTGRDGPLVQASLNAATSYPADAYGSAGATTTVGLFGEWERLPRGAITLPAGQYTVQLQLTEESFHTSGLGGTWARAMDAGVSFTISRNHAPILDPAASLALTAITEDSAAPAGDTVQTVLASDPGGATLSVTDADNDPLGIAIVGLTQSGHGAWQYAPDNGPWTNVGTVSPVAALLLDGGARLRFVPDLTYNNGQTSTLTFRAWDHSSGASGQNGVDTSVNGGAAPFSRGLQTAVLHVLEVNDAPLLDRIAALAAPEITAGNPDPPGFNVQSVLTSGTPADGISDPDANAVKGIAITAAESLSGGRWQFRLAAQSPWLDTLAVNAAAALLLPPDAELRFVPPRSSAAHRTLTLSFRAWDQTSGSAGTKADTTANGGTTAFSAATASFTLLVRENWWYPSFSWQPVLADRGMTAPYDWYHVQVFAADDLTQPYFEANVHGTTMTAVEYFLAAFDGFPGGRWLWRYRPWDPTLGADGYGPFTPASWGGTPDPAYVLDLDYGPAAPPTALALAAAAPGIHRLNFLVSNARGYEVRVVRDRDGMARTWRHAFIPGEDPDKQQGTPATAGQDNPPMDPPMIPVNEQATASLAVNLPEPGIYRLYVRGFNPTDERDGLAPFTEFPVALTVATAPPAYTPDNATGMIPGDRARIATPASTEVMPHRLQWDPVPGAQRFVLYLAAANASPLFNFDDIGSATQLDVALPPGSYSWQVVGLNDAGPTPTPGHWSAAQHFEVVRDIGSSAMVMDEALAEPSDSAGIPPGGAPSSANNPRGGCPRAPFGGSARAADPERRAAAGVRIVRVARISTTRIRVSWAPGGAPPDVVEVMHVCDCQHRRGSDVPCTLQDVDLAACTGIIEITDLARSGTHHVLMRGAVHTPSGTYLPGEPRVFVVPQSDNRSRGSASRHP
jgi:hypothetical protein